MGEPLDDEEREVFKKLTGREREPLVRCEEIVALVGRRGGKSRAISVLAVLIAVFVDHGGVIVPGERPVALCLAPSQKQAAIVFAYIAAIFESTPILAKLVSNRTAEILSLSNGIDIEVRAASFRNTRGVTAIILIADEACFFYSDDSGSTNPDSAIIDAIRPSLATTNGMLVILSSPHARKGVVFETWQRHYGPTGDPRILVAQGASRDFNPSLPQSVVDRAMERDPASARAEYLGLFRNDLEAYISRELIEEAVDTGVLVRPRKQGIQYAGYADAASGTGKDSFAIGIAHAEGDEIILDLAHEIRPPFNPQTATTEASALFKAYGISNIRGDKFAAGFVIEAFAKHGIKYEYSQNETSENYLNALPLFTAGRVRLVDNKRLVAQFAGLERRTSIAGRDRVDHGSGDRHDDISAAVSGALVLASSRSRKMPLITMDMLNQVAAHPAYRDRRYSYHQ